MIDLGINLFQEIAALGGGGGGFSITNSLRFNDDDSAYLSRTPSVAGNRKTWTWSGWVKRGNVGTFQTIFSNYNGAPSNGHAEILFLDNDKLQISATDDNVSSTYVYASSQVFRDSSGWYHLVVSTDTTNATASDRVKIYVNGQRITSFTTQTNPTQDYQTPINRATPHAVGSLNYTGGGFYLDGYLAEINFIDGQALTADDFGQIDATTGEWSPKAYAGTYGTNGFYLPFDGNANDSSGNSNNWTENNLASTDYMIDTPTNNFSVLNPLATTLSTSEGNLKTTTTVTSNWQSVVNTIGVSSGKWYFETCAPQALSNPPYAGIGITTNSNFGQNAGNNYLGSTADSWGYLNPGQKYNNTTSFSYGSAFTLGDVIGCALDMDAGTVTFYKNNVSQGVAFTGLSGTMFCGACVYTNSGTASNNINFGADSSFAGNKTRQGNTDANGIGDFYYAPPAGGYLALCTDNLPAPAIEQPETQFNVVTYTGNSADRNIDLGFEADFVWIKARNSANAHRLYDRVRGNGQVLFSNLTNAEFNGVNDGIHFDYANGFNIDVGANVTGYNETGSSYVAWCWKAGGTAVTNTDGAITSQVSVNTDAGFSIVSYTGNGIAGASIGHGLSQAPELIISKSRNNNPDSGLWAVYANPAGSTKVGVLNATDAFNTFNNFNSTAPTSSVWYTGSTSGTNSSSSSTYIAYCFHSVESFSKIGSYVGNGSANGPFVYTGFKPAFVLYKGATEAGSSWIIWDSARNTYNPVDKYLLPNSSGAESTAVGIDILSNGFKLRTSSGGNNTSGQTYIYMAFAEHPFKEALAR